MIIIKEHITKEPLRRFMSHLIYCVTYIGLLVWKEGMGSLSGAPVRGGWQKLDPRCPVAPVGSARHRGGPGLWPPFPSCTFIPSSFFHKPGQRAELKPLGAGVSRCPAEERRSALVTSVKPGQAAARGYVLTGCQSF